tara:strand:+ start:20707 stop:21018 length:312 start_codon:yes stop_codon:yes gene_type:complete
MPKGRKKSIDGEQVEKLASFGCTNKEIASFFNVNESSIRRTYADNLTKGRDKGKIRLRQMQWKAADKGNVTMLIWLGKQVLGQAESPMVMEDELVEGFDLEIL